MTAGAAPASCSGKALAAKLGYASGARVLLVDAPAGYPGMLGALPSDVCFVDRPDAEVRLAHVFVRSARPLAEVLIDLPPRLHRDAAIWISWPKKASKVATDVTEDVIRAAALPLGLVDTKVCAVDAVWSALRLVRRKALR